MKSILIALIIFIPFTLRLKGYSQTIIESNTNPAQTQKQCSYYYTDASGLSFDYWLPPSNCATSASGTFNLFLYAKWKNIEASAYPSVIQAQFKNSLLQTITVSKTVGPFTLSLPAPTFVGGTSRNIPCHVTSPFTISLGDYKNTSNNAVDYNTIITSTFEWTLPSGWQTNSGQTGTFVGASSITVIPPASSATVSISVKAKANTQKSAAATLQITRNLEDFSITGSRSVVYQSNVHYEVPSYPGISYSWQLPIDWPTVGNSNYIDVIAGCNSGNLRVTMSGCNGPKTSETPITTSIIALGTTITGYNFVCASGTQFTVPGLAPGTNITWNASSNLTLSSALSNYCTYTANSNGSGWIEATINAPACGTSVTLPRKTVWVGTPDASSISGPATIGKNQPASFTAQLSLDSYPDSYYWTTSPSSGVTIYPDGRYASMSFANSGTYQVVMRAHNSCGWCDYVIAYINVLDGYYLVVSPNPATTEATIELVNTSKEKDSKEPEWDLDVYDSFQGLKEKKTKLKTAETKINTSGWKDGVYVIRATVGDKVFTEKMMVKH